MTPILPIFCNIAVQQPRKIPLQHLLVNVLAMSLIFCWFLLILMKSDNSSKRFSFSLLTTLFAPSSLSLSRKDLSEKNTFCYNITVKGFQLNNMILMRERREPYIDVGPAPRGAKISSSEDELSLSESDPAKNRDMFPYGCSQSEMKMQ